MIDKATPFGDFTKWCKAAQLADMTIKEIRIARLRALLNSKYGGNQSALAAAARARSEKTRNPAFFNELLSGTRSFGEKLARSLEDELQLERHSLDEHIEPDKSNILPAALEEWPFPLSLAEFGGLEDTQKAAILGVMQAFAPKKRTAARRKKSSG